MENIIHQMWFQGEQAVPDKYKSNIRRWIDLHPDHEYIFWDEVTISEFFQDKYPNYFNAWSNLDKMIKKCDCARYFILHYYGGIYADLDTIPLKPIGSLIKDKGLSEFHVILSEESHDPSAWKSEISRQVMNDSELQVVIGNAILISKKDADFWIDFATTSFARKHLNVLDSFSTWHLTKFLSEKKTDQIKVVPYQYLLGSDATSEVAYAIHRYDATWFNHSLDRPWEG